MIETRTRESLRSALAEVRAGSKRLALVPTMGYLHEGHLSLVDRARDGADVVALSIFVNPLQFGPGEDLRAYPRDLERDRALAGERGVDLLFAPEEAEMYPEGTPQVTVDPGPLAERLCGAYRPGHFRGVLTVVARLFGLFQPDVAVFGRKDFQQGVLIARMARDLEMPVEVVVAPTTRAVDGLAMSSRNAYLSEEERGEATRLSRALFRSRDRARSGERDAAELLRGVREDLAGSPHLRMQYAEIVHPETLEPVEVAEEGSVLALAAFCGETRLIDNVVLS